MTIRVAVLADIHGNLPALEAIIADLPPVDHVVVAGDAVNRGPFSAEVFDRIIAEGWPAIRGNHEQTLLDYETPRAPEEWHGKHWGLASWTLGQLGDRIARIALWPEAITLRYRGAASLLLTHGIPGNAWRAVYPSHTEAEALERLSASDAKTVAAGHSHLALDRHYGDYHLINPGSVGCPYSGDPRASYAVLSGDHDGWHAEIRQVAYDQSALFTAFEERGFREAVGPSARLMIEEFRTGHIKRLPFRGWMDAHHPDEPLTDELVETFLQEVDPAPYYPETHRYLVEEGA